MNELNVYLKRLLLLLLVQFSETLFVLLPRKKWDTTHVNYVLILKPIPGHISIFVKCDLFSYLVSQKSQAAYCIVS